MEELGVKREREKVGNDGLRNFRFQLAVHHEGVSRVNFSRGKRRREREQMKIKIRRGRCRAYFRPSFRCAVISISLVAHDIIF